jgi:hypothetical protein
LQPLLSGVHSVMRVKFALAGEGGGCHPPPFITFTITSKVAVYAPAEWADTLTLFHLRKICTLWLELTMIFGCMEREDLGTSLLLCPVKMFRQGKLKCSYLVIVMAYSALFNYVFEALNFLVIFLFLCNRN